MAAVFVLGGLRTLGYLSDDLYMTVLTLLAPAGVMALRAGMKK